MKLDYALEQFEKEFPTLGLLGEHHFVQPSVSFVVDSEVQLVCKYLKAYDDAYRGGKKRIDTLYPDGKQSTLSCDFYKQVPNLSYIFHRWNTTVPEI